MVEETLFKTESHRSRTDVAGELARFADEIGAGTVTLGGPEGDDRVDLPEQVTFEVELEREQDSTGTPHLELEFELSWAE